ncbi:MAG: MBL fold metallo-hydrolase [Patescibacteria group bacterium]|nr:MBL fold metallo-hydrolase [Patescibacteria group bacterium]MDE2172781.1 MBL fold metallo-hydrolase [Patescibacteria group bacterium]
MAQAKTQLTFCSGVGTVTGANFLLETADGTKILIDCGLVQGEKVAENENGRPFPYDLSKVTALLVTHAHLDHVGRIPKLVRDGYGGPIYSTAETRELARVVLEDAASILAHEARQEGTTPLYGAEDVARVFDRWQAVEYHRTFEVAPDISAYLKDAGHILGSAMIEITVRPNGPDSRKILFSGDLGNSPAPLLRDTEAVGDVDYLVMESVYGDRNHESRADRAGKLRDIVRQTAGRGGTLVIPSFAIDRTQVLLYELNRLAESGEIPRLPVFVDSPMAIRATDIYRKSQNLFNDGVRDEIGRGRDIFAFPHLSYTMSKNMSAEIEAVPGPKIILAGSGMSVGGRILGHEERYLSDEKSTILLVGYQAAGSLGRELADGAMKIRIHRQNIKVKARIETLYGYSAHKDSDHLVEFAATAGDDTGKGRLARIFVVMGEPGASMHLTQRLRDELGVKAVVPERGQAYDL